MCVCLTHLDPIVPHQILLTLLNAGTTPKTGRRKEQDRLTDTIFVPFAIPQVYVNTTCTREYWVSSSKLKSVNPGTFKINIVPPVGNWR
jgi:hypothetical protein